MLFRACTDDMICKGGGHVTKTSTLIGWKVWMAQSVQPIALGHWNGPITPRAYRSIIFQRCSLFKSQPYWELYLIARKLVEGEGCGYIFMIFLVASQSFFSGHVKNNFSAQANFCLLLIVNIVKAYKRGLQMMFLLNFSILMVWYGMIFI